MAIHSNLKVILDERNLSVLQVSKDIEYRYESLRKVYNNENEHYPKKMLDKLCAYLNVEPGDLISYKKNEKPSN
ncbi:helix-turn-helix transcriptional regulator [Alkalihalophilus marmarensis]|uniref:helix-turn-helix domain-containing protein n=1 Tax=Alkalihalophilus marmarensis TaxID=521377 RepID=UPI00203BBAA4|nr:helix-turn-helix transcriptional regulator [Alkalihalophilus marmarensis]MCM3488765.1 helix-turn-helix transcriptional regulator [Alkalihalophilus marmarensis]